ncbi:cytochrome c-type biogenesis protein [Shewanella algidipiscicola]|uniref:cytochrome c-type biogenesis protein n=1 Tax=Shewanella algidipiscicola TaxID=614070 RepID=UPI001EF5A01E|nr:cytochrome c-type biogenesis protein CcmH [Shewanella algidipiscicola]
MMKSQLTLCQRVTFNCLLWLGLSVFSVNAATPSSLPASTPAPVYSQAEIKALGFDIAKSLRCPMSANQNLLDSQTKIANELKAEIFLQLEQGKRKSEIIDFMVARYGQQIRYMPTFAAGTFVLYLFPLGLLLLVFAWGFKQHQSTKTHKISNMDTHHD